MQSVDITAATAAPSLPVKSIFGTIRSYILWQHERGTLHYDIMVTLILIFVFFSPRVIDFNDKPVLFNPHPSDVVVTSDAQGGLLYQISGSAVAPGDDQAVRQQLLQVIQPISGDVSIVSVEKVNDKHGRIELYRVEAKRK